MSHILGAIGCAIIAVTLFYNATNRINLRTANRRYVIGGLFIVASAVISHSILISTVAGASVVFSVCLLWSESRKARKAGAAR